MYYFEPGLVAVANKTSPVVYLPIQCGTSFQRLFLLSFDMTKKTYQQSQWMLNDGVYHYFFHDPLRQRLFGLRDVSTFTLIIEEYDMNTLDVLGKYTQQDGEKYAFPYQGCAIFDYEGNWIVEVRTRFENPSVNAYFIKMDLNLVGKKEDIVTDFHLMPDVHNLCSMTYDMKTKLVLATWQHGSIDLDMIMLYMDPYTGKFTNQTLLLKTPEGWDVVSTQAVFDELTRQIFFIIEHQQDSTFQSKYWLLFVEFDTMIVKQKKQVSHPDFDVWEVFQL